MSESKITINPEHRMTRREAEEQEEAVLKNIEDTGMRLLKLRDERGWEALNYPSFREYAQHLDDRMSLRKIYYLVEQAEVNLSLTRATGRPVHLPMKHALALKDLEPEQRVKAFKEATEGYKKGQPKPTEKVFTRVAAAIKPPESKPEKSKRRGVSDGWSKEDLERDTELADHLTMIEAAFGAEDVKAIKAGTIPMKRSDVLFLGKMSKENMQKIQDLIFTTSWSPEKCVRFINDEPDEDSTVLDLEHYCLTTKGKYWTRDFGGFTITVKHNRAVKR
jgi:hypothetical protein